MPLDDPQPAMDWDSLCFNAAVFVAGLIVLEIGSDKFIEHTAIAAHRLGISQTLIALLTAGAEWEEASARQSAAGFSSVTDRSPLYN